ncbi:glycosyltransferase family 4 protein [Aureisphaera galaxeae]|uniref:glycosyltransferase family 4 protein n=1 Tax=Aureisphaera galaxeae TaxID=1538023 RepID=UPI00234FCD95|nr:glycosyltransferase family 4 protein [Aureisphaera galaxeae]MDC8006311.1 glycosyltransferase family 4 protein [Aureisphaera galaxeae]
MKKRRILYVGNNLRGDTTNITTIETLSQQLRGEGYEVVTTSSKKNKVLRILDMLVTVFRHRRTVDSVLIDTYSTQNFYYAVAVGYLCRWYKIHYIPILHGGNLPHRLKKNKSLSQTLFHGAKTNVAPSQYLEYEFSKEGYTNLTYIPNTISISEYPFKDRAHFRPKLLWVRSFAEIYNPMLAVELIERLMASIPEIELCMVGPDKDGSLEKCKSYAESKKLPVRFTGKLTKREWRVLSQEYDLFINTTNFDNTPVSVIEAMALGLPIVSTNVGGMPYLIVDGKDGKLVPPNDLNRLAQGVMEVLENPTQAQELAQQARSKAESFDWEKVKLAWGELLKE